MAKFSELLTRIYLFFSSPKRRKWAGLIGVLFFLFLLMRGCSNSHVNNPLYTIGQDASWSTVDLMGKERQLSAFNVDLLLTIARQEDLRFRIMAVTNSQLKNQLDSGELDAIVSTLPPTPINQASYVFSDPYFLLGPVLIISAREPIEGWNEMAVKIIGVQSRSPALLDLEKDSSITVKLYDNILRALADLDEHRIDGAIFPALPAYIYTNTFYEGRLKIATTPLTDEGLRLIALKNEQGAALIQKFNQGLKEAHENNKYDELLSQWGLINFEKISE